MKYELMKQEPQSMKTSRRVVTLALLLLLLTSALPVAAAAQAQDPNRQQQLEQARDKLQQIKDRLELTPEQTEQVRPVIAEEMQQFKAVRDKYNAGGDSQNRRARLKMGRELKSIQSATDEKLRKILSAKQMDELKKIREEWRQQMRERADR
jgi:hypothetical protein